MSRDDRLKTLQRVYEKYKSTGEAGYLADLIRMGVAANIPWPAGMAEDVADLIDTADPLTKRKQTALDDDWMFYYFWMQTEFKTGEISYRYEKRAIDFIQGAFAARGNHKTFDAIRDRLRLHYQSWREGLTDQKLSEMISVASGGENKK